MTGIFALSRLRRFVIGLARSIERGGGEQSFLTIGRELLAELIANEDWLPAEFAEPGPDTYRQYLLHCDSLERFSVVSFVWGPGQRAPIHDHTTWGMIGMLRGSEINQGYWLNSAGVPQPAGPPTQLRQGEVEMIGPEFYDIHHVENFYSDRTSISIHVYGANIGAVRRTVYRPDGSTKAFISGYSNNHLPNLWDLSKEP